MAYKRVKRAESFAQWFYDTFGEHKFNTLINHKRNLESGLDIWTISKGSEAKVWFICENKAYHETCMSARNYFAGKRCKYCARTKFVHPRDSLGQHLEDIYGKEFLEKIWSDKNAKSPFKYGLGSDKKVWFKCINGLHEDTFRLIRNSMRNDFKCPECVQHNNTSNLQNKVYEYIKILGYKINTEYDCTIIIKNPKTNLVLPLDNEVEELRLIIEVNGGQHYNLMSKTSKWLENKTPEDYLHNRKLIDRYKRIKVKKNGFSYLEIPYWSDDNKESWKKLIDDKIKNIKSGTTTKANRPHF